MYDNTNTTTFSVVTSRGEQSILEWEDRLSNTNVIGRFLNRTTVETLINAINHDDDFIRTAVVSMGAPGKSHAELMRVYNTSDAAAYGRAVMAPDRSKPQRLDGIRNDLRTLAEQGDRDANGRIWSLLAYAAWAAGDQRQMRDALDHAIRLTAIDPANRYTPEGIPRSGDPLTVIMGSLLVMARHDAETTRIVNDAKSEWAGLSAKWDRELASLPPSRADRFTDTIVPSYGMPRPQTYTVPQLTLDRDEDDDRLPALDFSGFNA